jgi:hypothetical protein
MYENNQWNKREAHPLTNTYSCSHRESADQEGMGTCSLSLDPNTVVGTSEKQSMRDAMEHLFARYREMRPCSAPARNVLSVEIDLHKS